MSDGRNQSAIASDPLKREFPRGFVIALWVLAGVCLLAFLGGPPSHRAQEARVLVAAREMLDGDWHRWLLPTCNGQLRLQKPPLPYWLSAASFWVFGSVNEWTGRLPSAVFSWLTLGVVYLAGARWFNRRIGLLAAGMLLSSYLFFRHGRLAETDISATFFVCVSVACFGKAMDLAREGAGRWRMVQWFWLGGAAAGGAMMAKGVPGAFPILFVLLLASMTRNWRGLKWFALSGALPVAAVVAGPWYGYVWSSGNWEVLRRELEVLAGGEDHPGSLLDVVAGMFVGTAPWCAIWPVAIVVGIQQRKNQPRIGELLCWLAAVLGPILFVKNRQAHYLLPAMPPIMLLSAWLMDQATLPSCAPRLRDLLRWIVGITLGILFIGGIGLTGWGIATRIGLATGGTANFWWQTLSLGVGVTVLAAASLRSFRVFGAIAGVWIGCLAVAVCLPWILGAWSDELEVSNIRDVAREVQFHRGVGPVVFYQSPPSLALAFATRQNLPEVTGEAGLAELRLREPDATVLVESKPADPAKAMPAGWALAWRGGPKGHYFQLFRPIGATPAP